MIGFAIETFGTAIALWVTALVYSDISFGKDPAPGGVLVVAIIVGLANALIKPVLKILSFPISLMTMGLSGLVVNGVVLLLVAYAVEQLKIVFKVGHFPPTLDATTLVAAVVGAVVLSIVSLAIGLLPVMKTSR
ncbi:MAG: phage holin family protein [Candidatus Limnocylindrales bacterium]